MEFPFINWIQTISVYETPGYIYLIGSDHSEQFFRFMKIARAPVSPECEPSDAQHTDNSAPSPTIECESLFDRQWRLNIVEDSRVYTHSEIAKFLLSVQSIRTDSTSDSHSLQSAARSSQPGWFRFGGLLRKRPVHSVSSQCLSSTVGTEVNRSTAHGQDNTTNLQHAATLALDCGSVERSFTLSTKCHGVVGVVRFLRGYYLILVTKCRMVAQIGAHKIFKVEDTSTIYIPGNNADFDCGRQPNTTSSSGKRASSSAKSNVDDSISTDDPLAFFQQYKTTFNYTRLMADEARYLKFFNSIDLANNFYFSYTYDLSHTLQYNMKSVFEETDTNTKHTIWAIKPLPDDRFVWNWRLIPLKFRPDYRTVASDDNRTQPDWFILLYHGTINQAALSTCGLPIYLTLIGRRSRHFAGTRFLKRGANLVGDVANEVETEQIVHDTSSAGIRNMRCSSYVQMRGSVPLFWSQEPSKVVVGRPPLEILREDPYFEVFGVHFSNLLKRYGSPIISFNLMKRREKRRFEQTLSEGYERGLIYLSQFLPSHIPENHSASDTEGSPPIMYVAFDLSRVQKHRRLVALDQLHPIVDVCVKRTGIFIYSLDRRGENRSTYGVRSRQCGLIRMNCLDCLDRTNTAQFVVGHVALAYQLYNLGFLFEPYIRPDSALERLLQNLYDEHGDHLALQYGGSQLVHNINTYKKNRKLTSHSRDFMQTISRYYSNKFSDWDKQCVYNLFLRTYRPIEWSGTLFHLSCEQLYQLVRSHIAPTAASAESLSALKDILYASGPDNLESRIASMASSMIGHLWDVTTDGHMHWLEAWSRVSLDRSLLTDWCSRPLLQSLPYGLDWKQKTEVLSSRAVSLPPEDPRVNWFLERYRPFKYETLKQNISAHLRWCELFAYPSVVDDSDISLNCSLISSGNVSLLKDAAHLGRLRQHSIITQPAYLSSDSSQLTSASSVPNLTTGLASVYDHDVTIMKVDIPSTAHNEAQNKAELTNSPRKRTAGQKINDSEKNDDSSSESDSTDASDGFLRVYPLKFALDFSGTASTRDSDPFLSASAPPVDLRLRNTQSRLRTFGETAEPLTHPPIRNQTASCNPTLLSTQLKPTEVLRYQRYLDSSRSLCFPRDTTPLQTRIIPPSPEAMDLYRQVIDVAHGGNFSLSPSSLSVYRATVTLATELRY